jgi:hypothetical protein
MNIENINATSTIAFILGCIGLVAVMLFDELYWGNAILVEGWPNLSSGHIVRSIIIFISIVGMVWSLIGNKRPEFRLDENSELPFEQLSILGVLSVSIVFLFLFIFKPSTFNTLSLEDGVIEWGSFMFLFGGCVVAAFSLLLSRNVSNIPRGARLSIALLSLVFFVIAMEEVSWLQRTFEFKTPKMFGANLQHEMNLHNFYTNIVENIYYNGVFFFLVVFPFIRLLFPCISNNNYLRIFVARPFIGVIGSIACAYNFDMWNVIFTQIAFFASLLTLFVFLICSTNCREKCITAFTIFLIIATQSIFIAKGANFDRLWEVTEYKEFFIPMVLFIYSIDLFIYMKRARLADRIIKGKQYVANAPILLRR